GKDGSIAWYGDRNSNGSPVNRPDGYVNSTATGKTGIALSWMQVRFQDSTGNYIDYHYREAGGHALVDKVRYTGKIALPGQSASSQPYAEFSFHYAAHDQVVAYVAGGKIVLGDRLTGITS